MSIRYFPNTGHGLYTTIFFVQRQQKSISAPIPAMRSILSFFNFIKGNMVLLFLKLKFKFFFCPSKTFKTNLFVTFIFCSSFLNQFMLNIYCEIIIKYILGQERNYKEIKLNDEMSQNLITKTNRTKYGNFTFLMILLMQCNNWRDYFLSCLLLKQMFIV